MSSLLARPLCAAGLAVAACLAPAAWAMPGGIAAASPTYETLLAQLARMPVLREAQAVREAADARARQARVLPNPALEVTAENVFGEGQYAGYGSAETTLSLSQPLPLWGQRSARIALAEAEAGTAGLRREQQHWLAAAALARRYAQAEASARRLALAEESLALAEADAQAVAALVRAGREPQLRRLQADSEVDAARATRDEADALRQAAFARLAALAGWEWPIESLGNSLLERLPAAPAHGAEEALAVRIARSELESASRQVRVEQRRAWPEVAATVGTRRFSASGERAMTLGLNIAVPLFDRNRDNLRAAHAEQRAAEARVWAQTLEVQAERHAAQALQAAAGHRAQAADNAVDAAEAAYRLARIGFEAGRIAQLELRSVRASLISARYTAVEARLARVLAAIELAQLEARAPFAEAAR